MKEAYDKDGIPLWTMPSFTFRLENGQTVVSNEEGFARFEEVPFGWHTATEGALSGWTLVHVEPPYGQVNISDDGSCASIIFTNQEQEQGNVHQNIDVDSNADTDVNVDIDANADSTVDVEQNAEGGDVEQNVDVESDADTDVDVDIDADADSTVDVEQNADNPEGDVEQNVRIRSNADTDVDVNIDSDSNSNVHIRQNAGNAAMNPPRIWLAAAWKENEASATPPLQPSTTALPLPAVFSFAGIGMSVGGLVGKWLFL